MCGSGSSAETENLSKSGVSLRRYFVRKPNEWQPVWAASGLRHCFVK